MVEELYDAELSKNYRLSKYERETIITFNEEESTAYVYTMNPSIIRRLDDLCKEGEAKCTQKESLNGLDVRSYIVPKKWVKVRPPRKSNLTEEQRKALGERLANSRKSAD